MKTPAEKLGLKPGLRGWVVGGALQGFSADRADQPDLILAFVADAAAVAPRLAEVLPHYRRGRALWFAYPKLGGSRRADISRDRGWAPLTDAGLLPVSQIAIDADWSALRFRFRDEIAKLTRRF